MHKEVSVGADNEFRFFFGRHTSREEAYAMRTHFDWCDVYIPELMGWTPAARMQYREVAKGVEANLALKALALDFPDFHFAELEMLEGSGKRIEFVDVPGGHPLNSATDWVYDRVGNVGDLTRDWREALMATAQRAGELIEINQARDDVIAESIRELDARIRRQRVLVRLGTSHLLIARRLAEQGLTVQTVFLLQGYPFTPDMLISHYGKLGRAVPPLLIRQLLFRFLLLRFWSALKTFMSIPQAEHGLRRAVAAFTEADMADLWNRAKADESNAESIVDAAVTEKGLLFGEVSK